MNNEIEVEEYIRTKNGLVGKVVNENLDSYLLDKKIRPYVKPYESTIRDYCIDKDKINSYDILKHSKDIIDLIEIRRLC